MTKPLSCLTALALVALLTECQAVTLTLLPVGDAGNAPDSRIVSVNNRGAVAYNYYLDEYDVTNAQYVEFLNAKASAADPFALFDDRMTTEDNGGIARSASAPFAYTAKPGMDNKPVVFVSWFDALRFTNWLTNGQGNGDTESGSYLITGGGPNSGTATVPTAAERAAWAGTSLHYLLPSADEWYKAAYYKGGNSNAGYWSYPIKSNVTPVGGPPGIGDMNVVSDGHFALPGPVYLTDVGAYLKASAYGQSDMGGNVNQYTDSPYPFDPPGLVIGRGGAWNNGASLSAWNASSGPTPQLGFEDFGFRIAMVPEPASVTLAAVAVGGLLMARCRRRREAS